jgi:hypothetical protein
MAALTQELIDTILEVQTAQSLQAFALAGGTNLAIRFGQRQSTDIDLFQIKKDVYDLDYITDQVPLPTLMELLQQKHAQYPDNEYPNTFNVDQPRVHSIIFSCCWHSITQIILSDLSVQITPMIYLTSCRIKKPGETPGETG